MKSDSIVIVGGGSAGWMTASTLIKEYPNKDITVIESPSVPKIGVGESTTVGFISWLSTLEIDHEEFMKFTDASYKLSIKFTDFYSLGDGGFHYPFGDPYQGNCTQSGANDWHILKALDPSTPKQSYVDYLFPSSVMMKENKIFIPKNLKQMDGFNFMQDMALQFDALKFAEYLKEKYAKPRGVKHVQANIVEVWENENGISGLLLDNGQLVDEVDIYVDCSGFKGLLIKEALETPFESHEDRLPVNKAWAVQIPYEDPEKEVELFTNCTALGYGWVWNAPLYSRIGTGYVYSDKFTTPQDALEEFKIHLRKTHGQNRIDNLSFREVSFRSGVMSKPWNKNVVAIGLSGAFLEPLESNGLRFIHSHSLLLSRMISRGFYNKFDQEAYNFEVKRDFDSFSSFVQLHYILTSRTDTEFWKYMSTRDVLPNSKTFINSEHLPSFTSEIINKISHKSLHVDRWCGFHCIAVGNEWGPITKQIIREWNHVYPSKDFNQIAETFKSRSESSIKKWSEAIKDAPNHYQYLKNRFHNED